MEHEQEPKPYIYIGSAFPGSVRVQGSKEFEGFEGFVDIVRAEGLAVRIGEPDMFTKDPVQADRTVRERLIANSSGVILDLCAATFSVTADLKDANRFCKRIVYADLDPKSHKKAIKELVAQIQNDNGDVSHG